MNSLPWAFEPGTDFLHSNTGYVVVGMMLEKQTGRSMADLLKRDVFKPDGMNQTTFKTAAGMRGQGLEGAAIIGDQSWALPHFNPEVFSSAGSVVSTTKDMNAFTEALMQGRLVNPALVEQMKTPRSTKSLRYGLGLYRLPDPCSPSGGEPAWVYGHDGGAFGTVSMTMTSPDGSRQVSVGVTGRHSYDDPFQPQPYDHFTRTMRLLATTC
jgi:D-alanyl-D-alanine carboxypeptidase